MKTFLLSDYVNLGSIMDPTLNRTVYIKYRYIFDFAIFTQLPIQNSNWAAGSLYQEPGVSFVNFSPCFLHDTDIPCVYLLAEVLDPFQSNAQRFKNTFYAESWKSFTRVRMYNLVHQVLPNYDPAYRTVPQEVINKFTEYYNLMHKYAYEIPINELQKWEHDLVRIYV